MSGHDSAAVAGEVVAGVPQGCTLSATQRPLRVAEFDALSATALRAMFRPASTRLRLVLDTAHEATARNLAERESECCPMFTFTFAGHHGDTLWLDISVPAAYTAVLDALAERVAVAREVSW